jgi:peptide/nickel transport system substrate-binding protein
VERNYWTNVLSGRIGRRRALAGVAAASGAAALLAACGGGGDSEQTDSSGLVAKPVDTFKEAKRGGIMRDRTTGDPNTLDIYAALNPLNPPTRLAYNTLVRFKPGHLEVTKYDLMPDLAESWETSSDGLQVTLKLRQGVKWHPKPPVNGRTLDADDILFTWQRFSTKSTARSGLVNSVNPDAPVLSVTSPDARTIVIKMKEPLVYGLELFASNNASHSGSVLVVPKETDTTFTIGTEMIGAGPYYMSKYEPSVAFTMKRHADYFDKDWGLLDEISFPIITEAAAALAQFKAGNLLQYAVSAEDLLAVKQEEPRLSLYETEMTSIATAFTFGLLPEGKSPFLDDRVRRAVSMSWDRDLFIDTFRNVPKFEAAGLPVEKRWNTAVTCNWDGWWLDPQGKDFGPNAASYQYNIAEAKKLLAAAGFPDGIKDVRSNHITTNQLGDLPRNADVIDGMIAEIGITSKINPVDYATEYVPNIRDGHGQYEGWSYHTNAGGTGIGPVGILANEYWSKGGGAFKGFSTSGKNDQSGDPQVNSMIERARTERDTEKRRALVYDIQRYLAGKMYGMTLPGGSTGFTLAWPALANFQVWNGPQVWRHYQLWIDETKAPFKTA